MFELGVAIHCFWDMPFQEIAEKIAAAGIKYIEVSCLPFLGQQDELRANFNNITMEKNTEEIKEILERYNLHISTLTCNVNNLQPVFKKRNQKYLMKTLRMAEALGVKTVGTFVGIDPKLSYEESIAFLAKDFEEISEFALQKGIRIIFENCPGFDSTEIINIAAMSELWQPLFSNFDRRVYGLNLDLSHCITMEDEYIELIYKYKDYIYNVHAKDKKYGAGLNEYCLPGEGNVDWKAVYKALQEIDYQGKIIIENESPDWTTTHERAYEGIIQTKARLEELGEEVKNEGKCGYSGL